MCALYVETPPPSFGCGKALFFGRTRTPTNCRSPSLRLVQSMGTIKRRWRTTLSTRGRLGLDRNIRRISTRQRCRQIACFTCEQTVMQYRGCRYCAATWPQSSHGRQPDRSSARPERTRLCHITAGCCRDPARVMHAEFTGARSCR